MSKRPGIEAPQLTVDMVIFAVISGDLNVLLLNRSEEPFKGTLALPGGFLWADERLEETAGRILQEKIGLHQVYIEQLYSFDGLTRDPRGRILSVAYYAMVDQGQITADLETHSANFYPIHELPAKLAFDHSQIITYAVSRLKSKVSYTNSIKSLLPAKFTFNQLQDCYELVLDSKLDKRNFRKKYLTLGLIRPTGDKLDGRRHRPAALYEFVDSEVIELPSPAF